MNILYQYPVGQLNQHLFPVLEKEFAKQGITSTTNPNEATHLFLNVLSGKCEYDEYIHNVVFDRMIPIIVFDCREYGEMSGNKFYPDILNGTIYFVRNMDAGCNWQFAYPFDWPYFEGCDYEPTTKEELMSRPYDICLLSVESPIRKNLIDGIIKDGRLKVNYKFLDHTQRLSYNDWVNEHRKSKLYISADGGGYTNERPNQLFSVAAMLKNKSLHIAAHPFEDGINCIEINEEPTEDDIDKILDIIENKEWLWDIYVNGINHMKKYCSPEATAKYILDILKKEKVV